MITAIKKVEYTNWNEGGNGVRKSIITTNNKQKKEKKKKQRVASKRKKPHTHTDTHVTN